MGHMLAMARPALPPLQALRALEAAARHRSYSRAAAELGVTHGAISHQIRALEERLGARLFRRAGNEMMPTAAAQPLVAEVRRGLIYLESAWQAASRRRKGRAGQEEKNVVGVSVLPSFAGLWLLPRLGRFQAGHPRVSVMLRPSAELVDLAADRTLDLAIRYGPGGWRGLDAAILMKETLFPVAAPHFRGGRLPRRPADLAHCTLLRHPRQPWRPWFAQAGLDWPEPAEGPSHDDAALLLQAAAEGHGVALARASLAAGDLASGRLRRLFSVVLEDRFAWFVVWRAGERLAPGVLAFRDWLLAEAAAREGVPQDEAGARSVLSGSP
jgi:LysR family transcriptional regulator, glycine cleavage system transcriptional activator